MYNIERLPVIIPIGQVLENEHQIIEFDVSSWLSEYPNGTIGILYERPDKVKYLVEVECGNNIAKWKVKAYDTEKFGNGQLQIVLSSNGTVAKSQIVKTFCNASIDTTGEIPEPSASWLEEILGASDEILETCADAKEDIETTATETKAEITAMGATVSSSVTSGLASINSAVTSAETSINNTKNAAETYIDNEVVIGTRKIASDTADATTAVNKVVTDGTASISDTARVARVELNVLKAECKTDIQNTTTTAKGELQTYVTQAQTSAGTATTKANAAATSATNAEASATRAETVTSAFESEVETIETTLTAKADKTSLDRTQRSLDYLWKKSKGIIYDTEIVSANGDVDVPSGAMEYAELQSLGGVSRKGRNLLKCDRQSQTSYGITITYNEDGTYTINGTATATRDLPLNAGNAIYWKEGETYKVVGCPSGGSASTYRINIPYQSNNNDLGNGTVVTITNPSCGIIRILIEKGTVCNNLLFKPMVTKDTSLTYNDYEPYTPNLIDAKVDKVVSRGKNLYDSSTYPLTHNRAISTDTGSVYESSSGNWYATENYIPFDYAGKTICKKDTNKITICFYDSDKNYLSAFASSATTKLVPSGTKYIRFDVHKDYHTEVQIEFGSVPTSYSPYTETTTTIPSSILDLCPDYGIGVSNTCYNYIDFANKKYHHKCTVSSGNVVEITEEIIDLSSVIDDDFDILSVEAGGRVEFSYPNKSTYSCETPNKIEYMVEVAEV